MKESGIDWIGKIPEEWEVIKVKFFTYMKGRIGWQGLKADEFIDEGPYLVTGTDFKNGRVNWDTAYHISQKRYEQAPEIQLKQGDLLVTKDGTVGKLALIDELPDSASLNSHLLVLRPLFNRYDNHFLYYVLSSLEFKNYFQKVSIGSTMDSLSQEKMGEFIFALPNINEQNSISRYLDKKTAQLDKAKALLEEQIQKLKDYRASLIYETVTKGLDKTVPMKDSGIDWIGQLPQGWGIGKLEQFVNIFGRIGFRGYTTNDIVNEEEGAISYSPSNILEFSVIDNNNTYISWSKYDESPEIQVRTGDILYVKTGSSYGKTGIVNELSKQATINPQLVVLKPKKYTDSRLINYMLNSSVGKNQSELIVGGSTIPTITQESIKKMIFPKIPFEEQKKIADFLDEKTVQIDKLIQIKNKQIENINKQRQTLIYDYVTGKRKV